MKKQELIKTLKLLGWIALVSLILWSISAAAKRKSTTKTNSVIVEIKSLPEGNDLITIGDVLSILDKSFGYSLEGLPQGSVDIERVERVLEKDPFVLESDAFLDAENNIQIKITQRIPVLRILDKLGVHYYLDKTGKRLPLSKNYTARVLIATGNIPPFIPDFAERDQHLLKSTFELANKILADNFLWAMVEQIYVNNKNEFILIPKLGKQKIYLGKIDNMNDKLENLLLFYQKGIADTGWEKYKAIDLRYKGQVVGKK